MSRRFRYARAARGDLLRLHNFLLERDVQAAHRGSEAIDNSSVILHVSIHLPQGRSRKPISARAAGFVWNVRLCSAERDRGRPQRDDSRHTPHATRHTPRARRRLLLNRQLHRGHADDAFDFCRPSQRQRSLGPSSLPSARSSWGPVYNLDIHQRKRIHEK